MAVESGFAYSPDATSYNMTPLSEKAVKGMNGYMISVPATLQYYLLPTKKKLNTYIGAGVEYNYFKQTSASTVAKDAPAKPLQNISILNLSIVQGIIYEVNTKIQVRESIHFIPNEQPGCQDIGFNVGIGYNF